MLHSAVGNIPIIRTTSQAQPELGLSLGRGTDRSQKRWEGPGSPPLQQGILDSQVPIHIRIDFPY